MEKNNGIKSLAARILAIIFLVGITGGVYYGSTEGIINFNPVRDDNVAQAEDDDVAQILVKVMVDDNKTLAEYKLDVDKGLNAFDTLKQLDEKDDTFTFAYEEDPSFGAYPIGFNGTQADKTNQFWQFNVNGTASDVGVSTYEVQNGDEMSFVLTAFDL
jgi:Domain of unknown function (DUF4430)